MAIQFSEAVAGSIKPVSNYRADDMNVRSENNPAEKEKADQADREAVLNATQGNIVSRSVDGDTLRTGNRTIQNSEDGVTISKAPDTTQDYDNLSSYTRTQLDLLYHQGKISLYDHDQEIEKRDSLEETDAEKAAVVEEDDQDISVATKEGAAADSKTAASDTGDDTASEANAQAQSAAAFTQAMGDLISQQQKINLDPNLERFMQ